MDEFEVDDAYSTALQVMLAGAMPVIVVAADGMHVMSIIPNSRAQVRAMINPDEHARLTFMVSVTKAIKEQCEAAAA